MIRSGRSLSKTAAVLSLAFATWGCSTEQPGGKTEAAPAAQQATATEAAPAARPGKSFFRPAGTGPAVWGPGDLYTLLATGDETNNAYFQFEAVVPAGGGPPPHVHEREDETFYLVRGTLEVRLGDEVFAAKAGDFINTPRGTAHSFKNVGTDTAVMLVTFVPAGMEKYFEEVFPTAKDRTAAPPPITDELIHTMKEAAPRHGLEFVPPPAKGTAEG